MYVTRAELNAALRDMMDQIREMFASQSCIAAPRGTIDSVSTADSGAELLVDRIRLWAATSPDDPDAATTLGRMEYAGFLTVPRLREPAQVVGDANNGQYFPLASPTYRPSGGNLGDACHYNLTDTASQRATIWTRETGKIEIDSGYNAPSSQDVIVNHGTHAVARVADKGDPGLLRAVFAPIPMSPNTLLTVLYQEPTSPDGGPPGALTVLFQLTLPPAVIVNVPTAPGVPNDVPLLNYNTTGAPHFKG